MSTPINDAVARLVVTAAAKKPLGSDAPAEAFVHVADGHGEAHYRNVNERLGIDFTVEKVAFPCLQTMDPRIVRIAPGRNNEYHKHAHESVFVVLEGAGEVLIGARWVAVQAGDVAFVPRWVFHQSRNLSPTNDLVILAITDFGFTSAVLGDYDKRTRLAVGGDDLQAQASV